MTKVNDYIMFTPFIASLLGAINQSILPPSAHSPVDFHESDGLLTI